MAEMGSWTAESSSRCEAENIYTEYLKQPEGGPSFGTRMTPANDGAINI
jgi:hypothetical protein